MARVAEGMARVASGIAMGRRQRSELAAEIKGLARRRRSEVNSLLESLRASRGRATRDLALEAKKVAKVRHDEIHSMLKGLKASRGRAGREYQREALGTGSKRRGEVKALLARFRREMVVHRQHRRELSMEQREKAAAFMRGLTSGVASMRDGFAKEGRDRAAMIRGRLAAYALDRHNAVAVWRGSFRANPGDRSAMKAPVGQAEPPAAVSASAEVHTAAAHTPAPAAHHVAAQSPDPSTRSGRRPVGNLGHRGSNEPHGGDLK